MIAFIHDFGLIGSHAYRSIGSWSHCIHCLTCFAWLNDFNSEDVYKARNSEGTCHFGFCVICGWLSLNLESASCLDWLIDWLICNCQSRGVDWTWYLCRQFPLNHPDDAEWEGLGNLWAASICLTSNIT